MTKTIVQVTTSDDNNVYVKGFNSKHEIVFRTNRYPTRVQHEKFEVDQLKGLLYTNEYHIPVKLLEEFIDKDGNLIVNPELDKECIEG